MPLVAAGVVAVALWVPESHGDRHRRFDPAGVLLSAFGLVALTYGIIEAGERGWTDARALATVAAGTGALIAFVAWQRRSRAPLVDLALFRSRAFTWGAILSTVASFGMFGLLFALPQYFQAIGGQDALGTGLRLLPIIGGLMVGARIAGRIGARVPAKALVTTGLVLIAGGLLAGVATGPDTGYGYVAAWITLTGLGLGCTMPPAMNAALGALSAERSGVGSGLIQAMRQVGTVLNSVYRAGVDAAGLPDAARDSVSAGVAVASRLGGAGPVDAVRSAFTDGMGTALIVAAVVAAVGAVLSLLYFPVEAEPDPLAPAVPPAAAESPV